MLHKINSALKNAGVISLLLYAFITAISNLFISQSVSLYSPAVLLVYSFGFSTLFFHLMNWNQLPKIYKTVFVYWKDFLWLNFFSVGIWVSKFYALRYMSPALSLSITLGAIPLVTELMACVEEKSMDRQRILRLGVECLILLGFIGAFLVEFKYRLFSVFLVLGFLLSFSCAVFSVYYLSWSGKLGKVLSSSQVLAVRFYLLIILGAFFSLHHPFLNAHMMLSVAMIAIFTCIAPLYLLQFSLRKVTMKELAIFMPLSPLILFVLQSIFLTHRFHLIQGLCFLLTMGLLFSLSFIRKTSRRD